MYLSLSAVESDIKRMIANAKSVSNKNTEVYSDAEKIRKMASTGMQRINPAYEDKDYAPAPTPLPDENGAEADSQDDEDASEEAKEEPAPNGGERLSQRLRLNGPAGQSATPSERQSEAPSGAGFDKKNLSFEGKTFQAAQEAIVGSLMNYEDEGCVLSSICNYYSTDCIRRGNAISAPFLNLPPRELKDYYQVIKHPVCLKKVQKLVRGIESRDTRTGVSIFKSWLQFENEIRHIWKNARTYNEDDSEIVQYANELEVRITPYLENVI